MERQRVIENPVLKDKVTFLKTAAETDGEYTLLELELAPGGGNAIHYHKHFTEEFRVLQGQLGLEVAGRPHLLEPGQSALAPINVLHRFFNQSAEPTTASVELRPGQPNFEKMLRISYGLAADAKVNRRGFPKNPLYAALLFQLADTHMPGFLFRAGATPTLNLMAAVAKQLGVEGYFGRYIRD